MDIKKWVWVTTQKEGFHNWSNAPEEVGFLSSPHRHIFHFKVSVEIFGDDRDIEFIMLKWEVQNIIDIIWSEHKLGSYLECDGVSCEMISNKIYETLASRHEERDMIIEVSEDNENGSRIEYLATKS